MNDFWVVYDKTSGEELYRGSGAPGAAGYQTLPDGTALIAVPMEVVRSPALNLDALRDALSISIDNMAEQMRSRFVTALPAQIGTYVLKESAARAWLADNDASTVMLAPEAAARGMTVAELAAEVIANANAWNELSGQIEGIRFGAKARVTSATTIGAMAEAAYVDWSQVGG